MCVLGSSTTHTNWDNHFIKWMSSCILVYKIDTIYAHMFFDLKIIYLLFPISIIEHFELPMIMKWMERKYKGFWGWNKHHKHLQKLALVTYFLKWKGLLKVAKFLIILAGCCLGLTLICDSTSVGFLIWNGLWLHSKLWTTNLHNMNSDHTWGI